MSQDRQSACVPPPADYSQHARPAGKPRAAERPERGGYRGRPSFNKHRGGGSWSRDNFQGHQHQATRFQRDPPAHYDSAEPVEQITRPQPKDRFHRNDDDDYFALVEGQDTDQVEASASQVANNEDNEKVAPTSDDDNASNDEDNDATKTGDDDDDDDPLEAYMKSLESGGESCGANKGSSQRDKSKEDCDQSARANSANSSLGGKAAVRLDIDDSDDLEESYIKFVERQRQQQQQNQQRRTDEESDQLSEKQELIEYDKDGNVLSVRKVKREVDPLPPVDHSTVEYDKFEKSFYEEHEEIQRLSAEQSDELRKKLEIRVSGEAPPRPVCSFAHFNFEEKLMKIIRRSEYVQPTPIQAQAIPTALLGRNLIGIAMTGSGKTAAYLWPMIVHISKQASLKQGDGPVALVLVPTRELALQVSSEAKKFANSYKLRVICAYGGGSRFEQSRDLEAGAEIVVATPGRMIDLIRSGATNLKRVTYLVLDEADRFFDMGFEAQVRSICDHIRPDRQTLLFSATFKHKVEQLARTVTENPVKIVQKTQGEANEDVTQHFVVLNDVGKKWDWLSSRLVEFTSCGSVLIFVTRITNSEELHKKLEERGGESLLLHGDMEQSERNRVIMAFKRREKEVLVATDVAARGLDIAHIRTVINYDVARDIDTHTHRIGRTGRAGSKGDAYTLLTSDKDKDFAGQLVRNLECSHQKVGDDLYRLAMQSHAFRKTRQQRQSNEHHRQQARENTRHGESFPHKFHNNHNQQNLYHPHDHHQRAHTSQHARAHDASHSSSASAYQRDSRNASSSFAHSNQRAQSSHNERRYHEQGQKRGRWENYSNYRDKT